MKKMWIITLVALVVLLLAGCAKTPETKYRYCITQGESHFSTTDIPIRSDSWITFIDEYTGRSYMLYGTFKYYTIPIEESCSWDVP